MKKLALLLAVLATPSSARAHSISDPRVIVLVPKAGALEIRVNDMSQPGDEAVTLRRRFDGNHDGTLDDAETSLLGSFLVTRATLNLRIWQNGKSLALKETQRALKGADGALTASTPLSIDVVLTAPVTATSGVVTVEVGDWRGDGHAVKAAILADAGVTIVKSSRGELEKDRGVVTGVTLDKDVTVSLEYSVPAAAPLHPR